MRQKDTRREEERTHRLATVNRRRKKWRTERRRDRMGTLDDKTPGGQTQDGGQLEEKVREKKTQQREGNRATAYLHADDSVYEE